MSLVLHKLHASEQPFFAMREVEVDLLRHMHHRRRGSCRRLLAYTSLLPLRSLEVVGTASLVQLTGLGSIRPADLAWPRV